MITPRCLNEDRYGLGRGLRALAGYYQAFTSAEYIAQRLHERIGELQGLETRVAREELKTIESVGCADIGAWKVSGNPLFPLTLGLDSKKSTYATDLTVALKQAQRDYGDLAKRAQTAWDAFYPLAKSDDAHAETKYHKVLDAFAILLNSRSLGRTVEYKKQLAELDDILENIHSSASAKPTERSGRKGDRDKISRRE